MTTNGEVQDRCAIVLYGTETGNAQDYGEEIGHITQRLHFATDVAELDSVTPDVLSHYNICFFVVSTTGQGDFPSNARRFWTSLLKKKLPPSFLCHVTFALFGLGDSSYPKFNWAARKLGKRLKQLGAQQISEDCEADEQGDEGIVGSFLTWASLLRSTLLRRFPLPQGLQPIPDTVILPSKWKLHPASPTIQINGHINGSGMEFHSQLSDHDQRPIRLSMVALLEQNTRVTPKDHWQDVRYMTLTVKESVDYLPGDALAVLPKNLAQDVNNLIERMDWTELADKPIALGLADPRTGTALHSRPPIEGPLPYPLLTLRSLLSDYLDITAIPRRSFFSSIANYTNNPMHKERLLEFTDAHSLDEYFDYATRPRRSILEILQEFDSVKIPWQEAANVFPTLRSRQFSIASGGDLKHNADGGTTFELLIAIVKYRTVIKRVREGVCTRYLAALKPGSTLKVVLRIEGRLQHRNELKMKHHMLIGTGTGIAPLRSIICEKQALASRVGAVPPSYLVFGSRSASADFFFKEMWSEMQASGVPGGASHELHVMTAFSRDQRHKIYIQDKLRENAVMVFDLIFWKHAMVIVCGSSGQMPKAVRGALIDVLVSEGLKAGLPDAPSTIPDAEGYLALMEKQGRFKQETW